MVEEKKQIQYILEEALQPIALSDFVIMTSKASVLIDAVYRLNARDIVLVKRFAMTPRDFKRMVSGFGVALETYERENGPIEDTPRIVRPN